jgi:hypothetical protein
MKRDELGAVLLGVALTLAVLVVVFVAASFFTNNVYVNSTSNVLGILGAPGLLAALAMGGWIRWHRTCKVPYCLRLGEHPVKGTTAKVCNHHHTREHHELVHDLHHVEGRLGWGESHDRPTRST